MITVSTLSAYPTGIGDAWTDYANGFNGRTDNLNVVEKLGMESGTYVKIDAQGNKTAITAEQFQTENQAIEQPSRMSAVDAEVPFSLWSVMEVLSAMMRATVVFPTPEVDETIHIERGYENIVEKLQALGADIRRVEIPANAVSRAI